MLISHMVDVIFKLSFYSHQWKQVSQTYLTKSYRIKHFSCAFGSITEVSSFSFLSSSLFLFFPFSAVLMYFDKDWRFWGLDGNDGNDQRNWIFMSSLMVKRCLTLNYLKNLSSFCLVRAANLKRVETFLQDAETGAPGASHQ